MKVTGIIPARYQSTRFPGKALADVMGQSMVMRVYTQACKAKSLDSVLIATDHQEIYDHAEGQGARVVMTGTHENGTERCNEACDIAGINSDFIVNIQGDEPFIQPKQIDLLCSLLDKEAQIATLVKEIEKESTLFNPNTPKVVFNQKKEAIYFSRHPIPYLRDTLESQWFSSNTFYKHIGIYAYRRDILREITRLKPSRLEKAESLEQLRWLENGHRIKVGITRHDSIGVDTPEELQKLVQAMVEEE